MSTLKVDSIESRTSGNRIVFPDLNFLPPYRNILINGDMSAAQRGTSATSIDSTSQGYLTVDRWLHIQQADDSNTGKTSMTQSTDVPSGQGFANSIKIDCTTAQTSISGTNSRVTVEQRLEGQQLQHLKKGTSNAESLTLSFWVKSSKTGTYICALRDVDNSRVISKSYTINSANTWEKKTITYEGDTTGAFDNDNARSLDVIWGLAAGSDYSSGTLQTTWGTISNANILVGQVNLMDSTSNEWYITGAQLEAGDSATPFEHLPIDVNLQRCFRYFYSMGGNASYEHFGICSVTTTTDARGIIFLPVKMRTVPAIGQTGNFQLSGGSNSLTGTYSAGATMYFSISSFGGTQNVGFDFWPGSAGTFANVNGASYIIRANNSTATRVTFSTEL